jgi:cytochrome c oxidase subunit II
MLRWLPENISSFGRDIDSIMYLIYYVVGAWLILTEGLLIYFALRYRKSAHPKASPEAGKTRSALAWVLVPVMLVLVFDVAFDAHGSETWEKVKINLPEKPDLLIRIEGRQFAWNFRNAGKDGLLDTSDDIVTNGQLHVPVGKVVKFELVSKDVVHSFWVPNLRLKQDAVPGRLFNGWFDSNKTGEYGIGCAELCGAGHGVMGATLVVHSDADYAKWVASQN